MKKENRMRLAACVLAFVLAGCTAPAAGTGETGATAETTADAAATSGTDETGEVPEEDFEIKEFFDMAAYLSEIDVGNYVTLGDYKDLEVTVAETTVSDEEIASMIAYYETQLAVPEEITGRALQEGDIAQLDYSGRIKETGEVFEGGTAEGQTLEIGSNSFIEGFESGMIGMEIGETKELELKFPDPYPNNPDLAGVPVVFTVTLNGIQAPGELTDDAIKELGIEGVETVKQFRDHMETYMRENAAAETLAQVESIASGLATENATFAEELPEQIMERYVYMMHRSAYLQAQSQGMATEDLIRQTMAMDGFEGETEDFLRKRAEEQVKELLVYEAVARAEKIEPSEEEMTEGIANILMQTGFETVEDYQKEQGLLLQEAYRENLMALAVRSFLAEKAKVTYE